MQSKGLKSLLQHHSSKASILWRSSFFTVQLSHPYMTTGKTIALTRQTFVGKVTSLLLNMLSRLVITFLLRSKRLLISWLQSPSAVILEPPKINSLVAQTVKRLPTMQDTRVQSLGREDLLEKGMVTHSSILASPRQKKGGSKKYLLGATPRPRSSGCTGTGGPRGATPRSRSGGAAVRRYPSPR